MSSGDESFLVRFARDYGWRAYAIPVLALLTVWILYDVFISPTSALIDQPVNGQKTQLNEKGLLGPDPAMADAIARDISELPPGGAIAETGKGTYKVVGEPGATAGSGDKRTVKYVVEVEDGISSAEYGGNDAFSQMVDATLDNPKGWIQEGYRFEHVADPEDADMRIQLTSVGTTHELCGHDIAMETNCFTSDGERVVINESRWVRGAVPFQGDLGTYRQYLINHEVGHGLGYAAHVPCGADGALAPIMMQQTLSLSNSELYKINPDEVYEDNDFVCRANPWPYPNI